MLDEGLASSPVIEERHLLRNQVMDHNMMGHE